jgi:hypothetical protein
MNFISDVPDLSDPFAPQPLPGHEPDPDPNEIPDPPPEDD